MKVIVGMSGGVDSSVTAYLLQSQGYDVIGLFMKNWEEDDTGSYCAAEQDRRDAESVCNQLGIEFKTVNFAAEYWDRVFTYFLDEFKRGRTPNPDILCNTEIKFKAFLDYAKHLEADKIATGHYVRIQQTSPHTLSLLKGVDTSKDQSYFLHGLTQHQLQNSMFPLGGMLKSEIREIASKLQFANSSKKDSTGICFIGERKFREFLHEYLPQKKGPIVSTKGVTLGSHDGLLSYTIGQRQGLRIGGRKDATGPWYVCDKDIDSNILTVCENDDIALYHNALIATDAHWMTPPLATHFRCSAKIRYRQKDVPCDVTIQQDKTILVTFDESQRAVTPGQYIVFYQGDVCLGGAQIKLRHTVRAEACYVH